MEGQEIQRKIRIKESEIEDLKKEYCSITADCNNETCTFYKPKENYRLKCSWTDNVTGCNDYIPEE